MEILKSIGNMFWELMISLPLMFSSLLFYILIFIIVILILKATSILLWRGALCIVCFLVYHLIAKPAYIIQKLTKSQRFFLLDDNMFSHLYNMEKIFEKKRNFRVDAVCKIIRNLFVTGLVVTIILMFIAVPDKDKEVPKLIRIPLDCYLLLEDKAIHKYDIISREDRVVVAIEDEIMEQIPTETIESEKRVVYYRLNEKGLEGANLRKTPAIDNSIKIVASLSGDVILEGLGKEKTDDRGIVWVKVKTMEGKVGWISTVLISETNEY